MGERNRFRWAWWLLAYAALGLGLVGIFVPGLPTVPFILLSAFAAARGSARLEKQLLDDPRFGPLIRDWQRDGSVPRRAKWLATWAMLASGLLLVALIACPVLAGAVAVLAARFTALAKLGGRR